MPTRMPPLRMAGIASSFIQNRLRRPSHIPVEGEDGPAHSLERQRVNSLIDRARTQRQQRPRGSPFQIGYQVSDLDHHDFVIKRVDAQPLEVGNIMEGFSPFRENHLDAAGLNHCHAPTPRVVRAHQM